MEIYLQSAWHRGTQRQFSGNICSKMIWDLEFSEHFL